LKAPQKSLKDWGDQKWRTKSGKPSTQGPKATGERYLPEKAIKALSPSEYAASTKQNEQEKQQESNSSNNLPELLKRQRDLDDDFGNPIL
jgi:hypothetical protein